MRPLRAVMVVVLWVGSLAGATPSQPLSAPPSFEELVEGIRTGNAYQRARLIPSLARIADSRVVPELIFLLRDVDAGVRLDAAQQLAGLADARSADALAAALTDETGGVRRYAADGLSKVGRERHVPALVASVLNHLPDAKTPPYDVLPASAALAAIGHLSAKVPPELIALVAGASEGPRARGEAWWRLLADVANCLGRIGDKAACEALLQARRALETGHQDYRAWYAVRMALAGLNSQNMAFHCPAGAVLNSDRLYKANFEDIRHTWIAPLAQLGDAAVDDLAWALQFESEWDAYRVNAAVQALGEIGGARAAGSLRPYVARLSRLTERERGEQSLAIGEALLSLLKADPTEATIEGFMQAFRPLDTLEQEYLVQLVSRVAPERIPQEIRISLCKSILLDDPPTSPHQGFTTGGAARLLGEIGGPRAGEVLSATLLSSPVPQRRQAAAGALGTIKDYDAVPVLVRASVLVSSPVAGTIAAALGRIADPRAVPALKDMVGREGLSEPDRLWIAAALARLGVDYAGNAAKIRQALPEALGQAQWLHDEESIQAISGFISGGAQTSVRAARTLEAIGTDAALEALTARINALTIDDTGHFQDLCGAAARLAGKLKHPGAVYWTDVGATVSAVRAWFWVSQIREPAPDRVPSLDTVTKNLAVARRVWIAEATRRLVLAATGKAEPHEYSIPPEALLGAKALYSPELAPTLERIAGESTATASFAGTNGTVRYYNMRSLAAGILTDKTGQLHTFVDIDGRTRAGGWNPSQPDRPYQVALSLDSTTRTTRTQPVVSSNENGPDGPINEKGMALRCAGEREPCVSLR